MTIRLNPSTKEARRCACRQYIIAEPYGEAAAEAVARHRETDQHRDFDWSTWQAENTTTQPVRTVLRRVDKVA